MKLSSLMFAAALSATVPAYAADKHDHDHTHAHEALHGGVVVEVRDIDLELVARADLLQLHLRDHGKPVDVAATSARATLLAGTSKQEVELKPSGDRLEARGNFSVNAGTKVVVVVKPAGKSSMTARFTLK